jgi:hypothetical protein
MVARGDIAKNGTAVCVNISSYAAVLNIQAPYITKLSYFSVHVGNPPHDHARIETA